MHRKPPSIQSASTQADWAYARTRADIMSCRLMPGARIRISDIAETLGVSLGAVREALARLAAENMAIASAQRGYSVASVSIDELVDLTRTRIAIEQLSLRSSIAGGDVEWETGLVAALHRLQRIPEVDPSDLSRLSDSWAQAHLQFHDALVAGCGSPWTLKLRSMLFFQTDRYRRLSVPLRTSERDVGAEHKALCDAALARDVELACRLISEHLMRTADILLASPLLVDPAPLRPERASGTGIGSLGSHAEDLRSQEPLNFENRRKP